MLYDVLVVLNCGGGKRVTTERDAPLSGDTFEQDSESYRVLAIQPGHGPFDCVIEAEARQFGTRPVRADLECVARRALNAGLRTATRSARV